jgi:hypothetical protein
MLIKTQIQHQCAINVIMRQTLNLQNNDVSSYSFNMYAHPDAFNCLAGAPSGHIFNIIPNYMSVKYLSLKRLV